MPIFVHSTLNKIKDRTVWGETPTRRKFFFDLLVYDTHRYRGKGKVCFPSLTDQFRKIGRPIFLKKGRHRQKNFGVHFFKKK